MHRTVAELSWAHNIILIQKLKDHSSRLWYAQQTLEQGWNRDVLAVQIKNRAHERQGAAVTNFDHEATGEIYPWPMASCPIMNTLDPDNDDNFSLDIPAVFLYRPRKNHL